MPDTIALSSRVRLARNYADIPFPMRMDEKGAKTVYDRTLANLAGEAVEPIRAVRMEELSGVSRRVLMEQHKVSPQLIKNDDGALIELMNGGVYIMVNEEDHLRIQSILPGLALGTAMELACVADDKLEAGGYAFDEALGYLTSCPTNTGTGMRASVMLHLPALTMLSQIGPIVRTLSRIGLTVRGLYGEGSEAMGNLYQVSNQITLGRNEGDILRMLNGATLQVMDRERAARALLMEKNPVGIEDRLLRSYGIFVNARRMDVKESMQRISDIRLATDLKLIDDVEESKLNDLMQQIQPASLQVMVGEEMSKEREDVERARLIRETMEAVG